MQFHKHALTLIGMSYIHVGLSLTKVQKGILSKQTFKLPQMTQFPFFTANNEKVTVFKLTPS